MPVVIAGLILSFLVMMLFGGTELDRILLTLAQPRDAPGLRQAAGWVSDAAAPLPLFVMAMAGSGWLIVRFRWFDALLLLGLVTSGHFLVTGLQALTRALRPEIDPDLLTTPLSLYPSGQAAGATITGLALAFILARRFPARAWALAAATLFALAVGGARLAIGGNWPSDVIGGWALGLAWTLLMLMLAKADLGDGMARPARAGKKGPPPAPPRNRGGESHSDSPPAFAGGAGGGPFS